MDCWRKLGIARTPDKRAIKRAYAALIKQNNPEDNPTEFQAIREAYERALTLADYMAEAPNKAAPQRELVAHVADEDEDFSSRRAEVLSEKEQAWNEQSAAIDEVIGKLLPLVESDADQAIEYCRQTLREERFLALDARFELEGRLLLALLRADVYRFSFVDYLAHEFEWDVDIKRKGYMVIDHFERNVRFSGAFLSLSRHYVIDLIRQDLRQLFSTNYERDEAAYCRMEDLLFADCDDADLAEFCTNPRNQALIHRVHQYLSRQGYLASHLTVVPPSTTQWLRKHKVIGRDLDGDDDDEAGARSEAAIYFIGWIVILAGLVAIAAFMNRSPSASAVPDRLAQSEKESNAEMGDPSEQLRLGLSYLEGENGYPRNLTAAAEWLVKAAEQGQPTAQEAAGILFYSGPAQLRDYTKAVKWLSRAAEQRQPQAALYLSQAYTFGRGVERDLEKAKDFLILSAEQGSQEGQRILGLSMLGGSNGVEKNVERGLHYLNQAISTGSVPATVQLAQQYLTGINIEVDYRRAAQLLTGMSETDDTVGKLWLSHLYRKGLGVAPDAIKAMGLLQVAREQALGREINEFAWALATSPNRELRDGPLAVNLMEELVQIPGYRTFAYMDTLAAAYFESGDYANAEQSQEEAIALIPSDAGPEERRYAAARLDSYRSAARGPREARQR